MIEAPIEVYYVVKLEERDGKSVETLYGDLYEDVHQAAELCIELRRADNGGSYELRQDDGLRCASPPGSAVILADGTVIIPHSYRH
jgi:hypothetical protein